MTDSTATPAAGLPPPSARTGALSHLRVLDLSRVLAGPWSTQNLADMGADVIKIEKPGEGDDTRHWGPPFLADEAGAPTRQACYFTAANRNKRSVTVDMATPEGQELIRELARQSDVVVENFKTGGLKRYGLDYDSLSALNPRLIYCSVTGFGHTGPYAARPGYDLLIQAMSGLMSITGHADGEPGGGPMKVGVAVIDLFTGMYATTAILSALEARHFTGRGQHIDIALLDVAMAVLANQGAGFLNAGDVPRRQGNIHPSVVPYQDFPTADGNMLLAIGNDGQFARFCDAAGVDWARDERYATNTGRVNNRKTLIAMMMELTRTRSTAQWVALLEANSVPCGPINNIAQAHADPHVQHRGLRVEQERYPGAQPPAGEPVNHVVTTASPLRLSETPPTLRYAPPALGQHTDEVLRDYLKLSPQQLEALRARRVV
ncbi:Crotonobetainyl-CoA:carnitine CoA-transferase CaiB [Cupriavidus necator]|uniref:CoA transferase n=1 Tax=Cupriavidus necator (strain ATCC 17699 / DSM 428 / KCTC 22496 / NCIMB 10442 / H16 / Stanier 337) TaxID=381666 RepID=Q0K1G3_CUPNH|nr:MULTISPECIES: CaiB/BaiF CoA-transferase family protein [Cupriavidus]KUE89970.1 CoA-transferase [Cupriavidus necator]QCC04021.1 CoA transferase [Cupriavidus necator H16]QQB78708.1 CoA transferase [Cupriavidus necator]WKA42919.1 CaiB/BaiF CoA-transferase family protein [Cupriavidus necator]CAJ96161.1 predicted acyl-CoA transferase/carnitine dehydratase [Cupriavidus necator H16]